MFISLFLIVFVLTSCSSEPENLEQRAKYQIKFEAAETLIEYPEDVNVVLTEFKKDKTLPTGIETYKIKADISWDGDETGSVSTEWIGKKGEKFGFIVFCDGCVPGKETVTDELLEKWRVIDKVKMDKQLVLRSLDSSLEGIEETNYKKVETVATVEEKSNIEEDSTEQSENTSEEVSGEVASNQPAVDPSYIVPEDRTANIPSIPKDRQIIKVLKGDKSQIDTYPVLEWDEDPWYSEALPVQFGDLNGELHIDLGHPNGVFIYVQFGEQKVALPYEFIDLQDGTNYLEDFLVPGYRIEATPYDFNKDGIDEIVVAVTDQGIGGAFNVFSYTYVQDVSKVNPFTLELNDYVQNQLWLQDAEVFAPIGSKGDGWSFLYTDKGFYKQ